MIYAFNDAKEKVEIVVVQETVTIPQGSSGSPWNSASISVQKLQTDYGMDDLSKYVLVGWSFGTPSGYMLPHHIESEHTDPYIKFDTRSNGSGLTIWGYVPSEGYSTNIKVVFIKAA